MEHSIIENWISGVNLQKIAHAVINTDQKDDTNLVPDDGIIWSKSEYINEIFDRIKGENKKYTIITHCSDHAIDEEWFKHKPENVKKWYAQNVNFRHPDLIPIPIGIENHKGPHRGSSIDPEYINHQTNNFIISNKIINYLYCNFNPQTNQNRNRVEQILRERSLGKFDNRRPFADYCEEMKKYLFVASPRGSGIDCHRTWESLYMGCIPIVEKHFMYDRYKHLPIIQIESWEDLSLEILKEYIEAYREGKLFRNTEELDLSYISDKIIHNE